MSTHPALSYEAELRRKALHLASLVLPGGMALLGMSIVWYGLLPLAVLALTADVARAYVPSFNGFVRRVFGPLMRADERPPPDGSIRINGATWVLISAAGLGLLFPLRIVIPTFTMCLVADAAAALVGRRFGRHTWGKGPHTVEGSLAFCVAGLGVLAVFPALSLPARLAAVLAAATVEALPLPMNDNLRVPLAAAGTVWLLESMSVG